MSGRPSTNFLRENCSQICLQSTIGFNHNLYRILFICSAENNFRLGGFKPPTSSAIDAIEYPVGCRRRPDKTRQYGKWHV